MKATSKLWVSLGKKKPKPNQTTKKPNGFHFTCNFILYFSLLYPWLGLLLRFSLVLVFLSLNLSVLSVASSVSLCSKSVLIFLASLWNEPSVAVKRELHLTSWFPKRSIRAHSGRRNSARILAVTLSLIFLLPVFLFNTATLHSSIHLSVDLSHPSILPVHPCNTSIH